jgi:anhydro-N-acetylmuramic acid kinase
MLAIGLMTGTALDGFIDAALIETDGHSLQALRQWRLHPYSAALRARLAEAVAAARAWNFTGPEPDFAAVEHDYTRAHADAVRALMEEAGLRAIDVGVVGFHGLTVLHRAAKPRQPGATRQIGDGALLADAIDIDVAFDFRSADVAAGGQGAPLAPAYHAALLAFSGAQPPSGVLNLGGVANLTVWGGPDQLIAFDTGPANGPLNEWMEGHGLEPLDRDGRAASIGRVHEQLLEQWLDHPFFDAPFPKSLDRYDFNAAMARGLSVSDGAATLTAFSAAAVARGLELLPRPPDRLIACGGGRKNPVLMGALRQRCGIEVIDCDRLGWRGDAIEAEAFAFLAARVLQGLPISYPQTTSAPAPMTGGQIARARR